MTTTAIDLAAGARVLRGKVVAARLTDTEAAAFAELIKMEQRRGKAAESTRKVTGSSLIRRLLRKAAKANGLW